MAPPKFMAGRTYRVGAEAEGEPDERVVYLRSTKNGAVRFGVALGEVGEAVPQGHLGMPVKWRRADAGVDAAIAASYDANPASCDAEDLRALKERYTRDTLEADIQGALSVVPQFDLASSAEPSEDGPEISDWSPSCGSDADADPLGGAEAPDSADAGGVGIVQNETSAGSNDPVAAAAQIAAANAAAARQANAAAKAAEANAAAAILSAAADAAAAHRAATADAMAATQGAAVGDAQDEISGGETDTGSGQEQSESGEEGEPAGDAHPGTIPEWAICAWWALWALMTDRPAIVLGTVACLRVLVSNSTAVANALWSAIAAAAQGALSNATDTVLLSVAIACGASQIFGKPTGNQPAQRAPRQGRQGKARGEQQAAPPRRQAHPTQPQTRQQQPPAQTATQPQQARARTIRHKARAAGKQHTTQRAPRTQRAKGQVWTPKSQPAQNLENVGMLQQSPFFHSPAPFSGPGLHSPFLGAPSLVLPQTSNALCTKTNNVPLIPFTAKTREVAIENKKSWNVLNVTRNPNRPLQKQFSDLASCIQLGASQAGVTTPASLALNKTFARLAVADPSKDSYYASGISMIWEDLFATYMVDENVIRTIDRQNLSQLKYAAEEMGKPFEQLNGQPMLDFVQKYELLRGECVASGAFTHGVQADPDLHLAAFERESLKTSTPHALKQHCEEILKLLHRSTVGSVLQAPRTLGTTRINNQPSAATSNELSQAQDTIVALVATQKSWQQKFKNFEKRAAGPTGQEEEKSGGEAPRQPRCETAEQRAAREQNREEHRIRCQGKPCPRGPDCYFAKQGRCFYHHLPAECPEALVVAEESESSDDDSAFYF